MLNALSDFLTGQRRQVIPNLLTASYTLKYDYMAPDITSVNKPKGEKYCKNTVTFEGIVADRGTSDELRVTAVEWAEGTNAWAAISANNLPGKTATVTATLDISSKTDGTYTIKLRAIDLGKNTSAEKTANFTVDRTPPVAPTPVLPLP